MARRSLREARVLLTGASSGIGWALARELARAGAEQLLVARRQDRLESLRSSLKTEGAKVEMLPGDVTDPSFREVVMQWIAQHWQGLDALINNAGIGAIGPMADADEARLRCVMEVNFFAPVEWTRAALPLLRKGRHPIIVNVGSVLGHRAVPDKAEYCASKFALHGISDAWRAELAAEGIDLLLVSPSTTASEFFDQLDAPRHADKARRRGMPAATVARSVVRAMRRGRHEIILSVGGRMLIWLDRLFPSVTDRLVARFGRIQPPLNRRPRFDPDASGT